MTTALDSSFFKFFEFWIWTNHNSLLSIATNQFASFFIDIRSRQCCFRVCQSGEIWNKRAFFPCILIFLLYKTNRFHVAVRLFSNRSQKTSKCGKNISDTLGCASCATFLFLPHFDVICDLLLNRRTATWNLLVLYNNEEKALFISKSFNVSSKAGLCGASASLRPLWRTRKKPFDVIYCHTKWSNLIGCYA